MEVINKSNTTVKRYLPILKTIQGIEFRGSAKTGKYYLPEEMVKKIKEEYILKSSLGILQNLSQT